MNPIVQQHKLMDKMTYLKIRLYTKICFKTLNKLIFKSNQIIKIKVIEMMRIVIA